MKLNNIFKINKVSKVEISKVMVGDKVHYQEEGKTKFENGIVKVIPKDNLKEIRVVYNCAGEWDNYLAYTSQLSAVKNLHLGWKH